jgi:uncharacterized protein
MRFWDSSAIVPLLVAEPSRDRLLDMLEADPVLLVWWGTPVECVSAVARREREGAIPASGVTAALARLDALAASWNEIQPAAHVRVVARRLLRVHPLRAADALQLAAALAVAGNEPGALDLVCLDGVLCAAAEREGLRVIGPSG